MQLTHTFTVPVPVEQAWNALLDIERIAPCMPGAALTSHTGDAFEGTVRVKVGPVSLTYRGKGRFVERDEAAHRVVISASGSDARGAGTAAAKVTASLAPDGDGTRVDVVTDLDVTGRAAQFGRGLIADVSGKLVTQFADCVAGKLAEAPAAAVSADSAGAASAGGGSAVAASAGGGSAGAAAGSPTGSATVDAGPADAGLADAGPAFPDGPVTEGSAAPAEEGIGAAPVGTGIGETPVRDGVGAAPAEHGVGTTPQPAPSKAQQPAEVKPIDLLEVSGVGSAIRRTVPYIVAAVVGFVVVFGLVWLFVR